MTEKKNTERRVSTTQSVANLPSLDQLRQAPAQKSAPNSPVQKAKPMRVSPPKAQQETFSRGEAEAFLEECLGHRLTGYKK
jgi:hypothetical protein